MDPTVQAKLDGLKPVYDDIRVQQGELAALLEAGDAARERKLALAGVQKQVDDAIERLPTWRKTQRAEISRRARQTAPPLPAAVVNRPVVVGKRQAPKRPVKPPEGEALLPQLSVQEDRVELKRVIGRFVRYRLDQVNPDLLPEFNRLLNNPDCPVGQALVMLDWGTAYAQPLHDRETADEWCRRLDRWGAALEDYRNGLTGDVEALRLEYNDMLPLLDRWRKRATDPQPWEGFIADLRAALQAQLAQLDRDADEVQRRLADLSAGSGLS